MVLPERIFFLFYRLTHRQKYYLCKTQRGQIELVIYFCIKNISQWEVATEAGDLLDCFENCEGGHKFEAFNCIFLIFAGFLTDDDLSHSHPH